MRRPTKSACEVGLRSSACSSSEEEERGPIPDGWGRFLTADREVLLHLEWDRGSELAKRLRLKQGAYVSYFRDHPGASQNQVLFVAPTDQREEQIRQVAFRVSPRGRECCQVWTTTTERLTIAGPLGSLWRGVERLTPRIALPIMAGRPRSSRPVEDCIAKRGWWERRPSGGEGA